MSRYLNAHGPLRFSCRYLQTKILVHGYSPIMSWRLSFSSISSKQHRTTRWTRGLCIYRVGRDLLRFSNFFDERNVIVLLSNYHQDASPPFSLPLVITSSSTESHTTYVASIQDKLSLIHVPLYSKWPLGNKVDGDYQATSRFVDSIGQSFPFFQSGDCSPYNMGDCSSLHITTLQPRILLQQ